MPVVSPTSAPRNPDWEEDELVLALDAYLSAKPHDLQKNSPEVAELSTLLRKRFDQMGVVGEHTLRNIAGVYMKLQNLKAHDPEYLARGKRGLAAGHRPPCAVPHEPVLSAWDADCHLLLRKLEMVAQREFYVSTGDVLPCCQFQHGTQKQVVGRDSHSGHSTQSLAGQRCVSNRANLPKIAPGRDIGASATLGIVQRLASS